MKRNRKFRSFDNFFDKQLKDEGFAIAVLQLCFIDKYYPETFYNVMRKYLNARGSPKIESRDIYYKNIERLKECRFTWLELEEQKQFNEG